MNKSSIPMIRIVLAQNIKMLMLQSGMNQGQLAEKATISRGQINNIINYKSATTIDTLEKLADVFNMNPSQLI